MDHLTNQDKLLLAAIDLMAERGYKSVSTKEIAAAAGVSEMTLFRSFGSKLKLLYAAVDRFHYAGEMKKLFRDQLVWELQTDLLHIGRSYREIMDRNRKLFLIVLTDPELSELREKSQKHPRQLKELLSDYFMAMQARGKMIPANAEAQAVSFMWMNYGAFMTSLYNNDGMTSVTPEEFMASGAELFARALTPGYAQTAVNKKEGSRKMIGQTAAAGFQIGVRRTYSVTRERAWSFLLSPEGLRLWLGELDKLEPEAGFRYVTGEGTTGELRVVKPFEQLRMTWQPKGWANPSTLQVRLLPSTAGPHRTTISFHQEKLEDADARERMKRRWEEASAAMAERFAMEKQSEEANDAE